MQNTTASRWKTLLFSHTLVGKNRSHIVAYIAVLAALNVVVNAFSVPLGFVQFSFVICISALTGILIGPIFGFTACFVGDTLGYMIGNGGGSGWTPWIGLSTAPIALFSALIMNGIPSKSRAGVYAKLAIAACVTFCVSTLLISSTALYLLWYKGTFDSFWDFCVQRFFVWGQIWNSVINYALLFICLPTLARIKPLKIRLA